MPRHAGVVAVTCLALEARVARGPGVSVLCNHSLELASSLRARIAGGVSGIISFGIAGGLAPHLSPGDWVVASGVRNGDELIATDRPWSQRLLDILPRAVHAEVAGADSVVVSAIEKRDLHQETGAAAVDMESHIAAKIAAEHRIPFVACRVIIDPAHRTLPPAATLGLRLDGTPDVPAVFRSLRRKPGQFPDLVRIASDAYIARRALRSGRRQLGVGMGFPYYNDYSSDRAVA